MVVTDVGVPYDVITFGETMLRFTPPGLRRLEQSSEYEVHVGGSESNTAVGLARLGLKVAWVSRLTSNALGNIVAGVLRQQKVDTEHVIWTDQDRVGLYFLEEGRAPRGSQVIYDRKNSAMARMTVEELPKELFRVGRAKIFHTTGISLAISPGSREVTLTSLRLAQQSGFEISFDVNHRSKLWTAEEAKPHYSEAIRLANIVFIPLRDARTLFAGGDEVPAAEMLAKLREQFPAQTLVMTMGSAGAMASCGNLSLSQTAYPADEVGRLGGGDAFSAGYLYGWLESQDLGTALQWGAAVAALKYSMPGDLPLIDREQVERVILQGRTLDVVR